MFQFLIAPIIGVIFLVGFLLVIIGFCGKVTTREGFGLEFVKALVRVIGGPIAELLLFNLLNVFRITGIVLIAFAVMWSRKRSDAMSNTHSDSDSGSGSGSTQDHPSYQSVHNTEGEPGLFQALLLALAAGIFVLVCLGRRR
jgi:hypothetical protein